MQLILSEVQVTMNNNLPCNSHFFIYFVQPSKNSFPPQLINISAPYKKRLSSYKSSRQHVLEGRSLMWASITSNLNYCKKNDL